MKTRHEIEARLDRSLEKQIVVPRLDSRFNAAVWSRIEAGASRAANPVVATARASRASRWLFISNLVGALVALVLVANFALPAFAGIDLEVSARVSLPQMSEATLTSVMMAGGYVVALAVLTFAVSLTSFGRRWRAEHF